MIFSLFGNSKSGYKVRLKNYKDIVIGSGTDLERAYQIGNFMNMLYQNIENENKPMTLFVVRNNLITELDLLIKYCIDNNDDYDIENWYNEQKEEIINGISILIDTLRLRKKSEIKYQKAEGNSKKQIRDHISFLTENLYDVYDCIVINIVFTFPEYFEYIK